MIKRSTRAMTLWMMVAIICTTVLASCGSGTHASARITPPNSTGARSDSGGLVTSTERCTSRDLDISIAKASASPVGHTRLLENVGMGGAVVAYLVRNVSTHTCTLNGYMLPRWSNVPGHPQPFASQAAMSSEALRSPSGSLITEPSVIKLPPGQAAGFVVAASSVLPAEYIVPGGSHGVPVPSTYAASTTGTIRESPISGEVDLQSSYCEVLNGSPTCIEP